MRKIWLALLGIIASFSMAAAHELDPGFLDIRQVKGATWQVFWRVPDVEGKPMRIAPVFPTGCTPEQGPKPGSDGAAWSAWWTLVCADGLAGRSLRIEGLHLQKTDVLLRFAPQQQSVATLRLTPAASRVDLPEVFSPIQVLSVYGKLGFEHILEGLDHLLFVFALLLLIRDWRRLVGAITAFTVAHSITLALATLGHISVPGPPVEAVIALSVVFLAIEYLKSGDGQTRLSVRAPWVVAFAFGLLHGLGFAGALQEIGLPETDLGLALLAFNLGVEAGQLAFVAVLLMLVAVVRQIAPNSGKITQSLHRIGQNAVGYAIGGVATFWLVDRLSGF